MRVQAGEPAWNWWKQQLIRHWSTGVTWGNRERRDRRGREFKRGCKGRTTPATRTPAFYVELIDRAAGRRRQARGRRCRRRGQERCESIRRRSHSPLVAAWRSLRGRASLSDRKCQAIQSEERAAAGRDNLCSRNGDAERERGEHERR